MVNAKSFEGYSDHYDAEVRLIILKALDDEQSKSLNDSLLMVVLKAFAIRRSRDYLRIQLAWLEENSGSIVVTKAGTALIAQLTERGADHLSRDSLIVGIKPPSLPR